MRTYNNHEAINRDSKKGVRHFNRNCVRKKRNIIWFMIDGVRNYPCPDDPAKLGKPEMFEELAPKGIEFSTAITAGTSTSMSLISYLTGIPSYFLGQSFQDFFSDEYTPSNLTGILREHGYKICSICIGADFRRDRWKRDLPHVPKKYWPKGAYRLQYWPNSILLKVLENVLRDGIDNPFLIYMHFNGRRDAELSKKIGYCLELFKDKDLYDDSIIVMSSDHGIPDNNRRKYTSWLKEQGLSYSRHDLMVTDDNILVPLLLRVPTFPEGIKVSEPVGVIDLLPTLLDILDIECPDRIDKERKCFQGTSLLPLICPDSVDRECLKWFANRRFRTDTRFMGQADRITSVRSARYKYVFTYDVDVSKQQQFYDLENDPWETENLAASSDIAISEKISEFRNELQRSNEAAFAFQQNIRQAKFDAYLSRNLGKDDNISLSCLLIGSCDINFAGMVVNILRTTRPNIVTDLLLERDNPHRPEKLNQLGFRNNIYVGDRFNAKTFRSSNIDRLGVGAMLEKYDLILVPFTHYYRDLRQSQKTSSEGEMQINVPEAEVGAVERLDFGLIQDYREIFKIVKTIACKNKCFFDTNFRFYRFPKLAVIRDNLTRAFAKRDIYLSQPLEFFRDLKTLLGLKKREILNW